MKPHSYKYLTFRRCADNFISQINSLIFLVLVIPFCCLGFKEAIVYGTIGLLLSFAFFMFSYLLSQIRSTSRLKHNLRTIDLDNCTIDEEMAQEGKKIIDFFKSFITYSTRNRFVERKFAFIKSSDLAFPVTCQFAAGTSFMFLKSFSPSEIKDKAIMAHEMGHALSHDLLFQNKIELYKYALVLVGVSFIYWFYSSNILLLIFSLVFLLFTYLYQHYLFDPKKEVEANVNALQYIEQEYGFESRAKAAYALFKEYQYGFLHSKIKLEKILVAVQQIQILFMAMTKEDRYIVIEKLNKKLVTGSASEKILKRSLMSLYKKYENIDIVDSSNVKIPLYTSTYTILFFCTLIMLIFSCFKLAKLVVLKVSYSWCICTVASFIMFYAICFVLLWRCGMINGLSDFILKEINNQNINQNK